MTDYGSLYVFEGPNGVGKTTFSKLLANYLESQGRASIWLSYPGREKGTLGNLVYELHHNPSAIGICDIEATSLQMLHVAAHIDQIEKRILPSLKAGISVVLDRYWWSTLVYGLASGVGEDSIRKIIDIEALYWRGVEPTKIFLLECPVPLDEPVTDDWLHIKEQYRHLFNENAIKGNLDVVENIGNVNLTFIEKIIPEIN